MMDRLEIAKKKYERIVPGPFELDERKSEEIEAWLRDYVMPVVDDLQQIPAFRKHVIFGPSRLTAESDTSERLQVVAVADAMAECAAAIVELGRQVEFKDLLTDHDPLEALNAKRYGISPKPSMPERLSRKRDVRCIVEKMADRPWFDLAVDLDFPVPNPHLFLRVDDSSPNDAFRKFRPNIPVLGDAITRMMFARIDFWTNHLQTLWNGIHVRFAQAKDFLPLSKIVFLE